MTNTPEFYDLREPGDNGNAGATPRIDHRGSVILESGETVWALFQTAAVFQVSNEWVRRGIDRVGPSGQRAFDRFAVEAASGAMGHWLGVSEMRTAAKVRVSDSRILLEWPRWQSDRALGSFYERRIASRFLFKSANMCGHVRLAWASQVGVLRKERHGRATVLVRFNWDSPDFRIRLDGVTNGAEFARKLAARVAQRRLADPAGFDTADMETLRALAEGRARGSQDEAGAWYDMPGAANALPPEK